jgi:hypothetical protein
VIPSAHFHFGIGAVRGLEVRTEGMLLVCHRHGTAHDHPLGEEPLPRRSRHEMPPHAAHAAEAPWDERKYLLEIATAGPPELVPVGIDHPVRLEVGSGEACHPGRPLDLRQVPIRIPDQMDEAVTSVRLEDLGRPVVGTVVCGDHEVDSGVEVKGDARSDHVRLVAYEHGHDDFHVGASLASLGVQLRRTTTPPRSRRPPLR